MKADAEILQLMLGVLNLCNIRDVHLDLGHVGVFRALAGSLALSAADENTVFDLLQIKAAEDLQAWCATKGIAQAATEDLVALCTLHGGTEVLVAAQQRFANHAAVIDAVNNLQELCAQVQAESPDLPVHLDLAELRGYRYQTGVVFAAFSPGHGRELARGGRYNGVGANFGVDRPATGFSADLNRLVQLGHVVTEN